MRSHRTPVGWLVAKEWRELYASRAWWIMLALIGPLVGVSFISAVDAFSEVSAGAGTACGIVCAPLIGIWGPTFGAYEIAAIFLLPFVAIRAVSGDRLTGALKLELQRPLSPLVRIGVKMAVILAGWVLSGAAALIAMLLWKLYGGASFAPELAVVVLGHVLNGALTIALAIGIATLTDHPSTAAIVTIAVTLGAWIVDFTAVLYGGAWTSIAAFTPAALVTLFQHGLLQMNAVLITLGLIGLGLAIAAVWVRMGVSIRRRTLETLVLGAASAALIAGASFVPGSWDISESRQNSFAEPEEEALERLAAPLTIDVHLSPQDPRRAQLERGPLAKLRRVVPHLTVRYVARTSSGLFEQSEAGYGEITYSLGGKHETTRVITDEGTLEAIFALVDVTPPAESDPAYAGHPLVARATGAGWIFYGAWPAAVAGLGTFMSRRKS